MISGETTMEGVIAETIRWRPAADKPIPGEMVLMWLDGDEWFSGWWDRSSLKWYDSTGYPAENVLYWADVEGPQ